MKQPVQSITINLFFINTSRMQMIRILAAIAGGALARLLEWAIVTLLT
jgi:hypothetical protein